MVLRYARQPPNRVISSAPSSAIGSHTNPATHEPSPNCTRPIASGADTPSTNEPKDSTGIVHTSTSIAEPLGSLGSTRTSPGFGGSVAKA